MSKAEIRIAFGVDGSNKVVHISAVERGRACDCTCPGCGAPLEAAKGSIRQHHFRHGVEVECEGAAESAIHLAAKQLIRERRQLTLSEYVLSAWRRDSSGRIHRDTEVVVPGATTMSFDSVEEECEVHGMRTDLLAMAGNRPLMIEIRYMHAVDEEKRAKIQAASISAIEIDLSDAVNQVSDWETLWSLINDPARMTWLYNTRENDKRARLESRLDALIAKWEQEYERERRTRKEREERERHQLRAALTEMKALSTPAHIERLSDEAEQHQVWRYNQGHLPFGWKDLPPFLNSSVVDGDWIYGCDRRLWQVAIYSYFVRQNGKPFSVRAADNWLQSTAGLKVPSCVNTARRYGQQYPDVLESGGEKSLPSTWRTVNAFCQNLCQAGILVASGPDRKYRGNVWYSVRKAEPKRPVRPTAHIVVHPVVLPALSRRSRRF
jgi:hypothetical protein